MKNVKYIFHLFRFDPLNLVECSLGFCSGNMVNICHATMAHYSMSFWLEGIFLEFDCC